MRKTPRERRVIVGRTEAVFGKRAAEGLASTLEFPDEAGLVVTSFMLRRFQNSTPRGKRLEAALLGGAVVPKTDVADVLNDEHLDHKQVALGRVGVYVEFMDVDYQGSAEERWYREVPYATPLLDVLYSETIHPVSPQVVSMMAEPAPEELAHLVGEHVV